MEENQDHYETLLEHPIEDELDSQDLQVRRLHHDGFEVVTKPLTLQADVRNIIIATPFNSSFPRYPVGKLKEVFFGVNNIQIFEHVASATSAAMDRKVREGDVGGQNATRYFKAVTAKEVLYFLSLHIIFRGRANIPSIEEQFKILPDSLTHWPISEKRFKAISSSLDANFLELADLIRTSWKEAINPGTEFSIDETLYSFHSRGDPTSPQRYVPRKPHPNGLLSYMAGFKTAHGPYLFDLEPDFEIQALNARVAMERIVQRWDWAITPHVIVDAGFSGENPIAIVGDMGARITAGLNVAHFRFLFDTLRSNCPIKHWLAVKDKEGVIWSVFRSGDSEHFLATTAFSEGDIIWRSEVMNEQQVLFLSKVNLRGLIVLAEAMNVPIEGDSYNLASSIGRAINTKISSSSPSSSRSRNTPSSSSSRSTPSSSSSRQNQEEQVQGQVEVEPSRLDDDQIDKMNITQLKRVAKEFKIKAAKKKRAELVEEIKMVNRISNDELKKMANSLKSSPSSQTPPHHSKYREQFNSIDLHDKKWYKLQNHHYILQWKPKFIASILQSGIVNAHVVYQHFEKKRFLEFCEQLALEICES